jgi:hypothetical protein
MADHDPLCPTVGIDKHTQRDMLIYCQCDLIGRVRADEQLQMAMAESRAMEAGIRERIAQEIEAERIKFGDQWINGDLVIGGRTYRLTRDIAQALNAIREIDARIARGGAQ